MKDGPKKGGTSLLLSVDSDAAVVPTSAPLMRRIAISVLAFLTLYGFLNFLIILMTLAQAGAVYIRHVKDDTTKG